MWIPLSKRKKINHLLLLEIETTLKKISKPNIHAIPRKSNRRPLLLELVIEIETEAEIGIETNTGEKETGS